jgi:hypothetical protein
MSVASVRKLCMLLLLRGVQHDERKLKWKGKKKVEKHIKVECGNDVRRFVMAKRETSNYYL